MLKRLRFRRLPTGIRAAMTAFGLLALTISTASAIVTQGAFAASCGGVETSFIDCEDGESGVLEPIISAIQILTAGIGIIATGAFIYAGILYASAGGSSDQIKKSLGVIRNTILGLALFASIVSTTNFLIPGGVFGDKMSLPAANLQANKSQNNSNKTSSSNSSTGSSTDNAPVRPGSSATLKMASWNTWVSNSATNVKNGVKQLMGSHGIDILGLQEVHYSAVRKAVSSLDSTSIGIYTPPGSGRPNSYPIVYNKNKLTLIKNGSGPIKLGPVPGLSDRYVVYARFKVKATGQQIYFANTHTPPGVERGGKINTLSRYVGAARTIMGNLKTKLAMLQKQNIPLFLVGDFNVNYRRDSCSVSWFPCKTMKSLTIVSSFEKTGLKGIGKSHGTHTGSDGSRLIDYVWAWDRPGVKFTNAYIISGSSVKSRYLNSDHKPSAAQVIITAL